MAVRNISLSRTFGSQAELRVSPAYSFVFDFEYWDMEAGTTLMVNWWWMSIVISAIYIPLMLGAQRLIPRPLDVRRSLIAWNSLLAAFSLAGAARMLPELLYVLYHHGFHYSICNNSFATEAITGFWTEMFAWSKLAEMVDTAFLVAKKRRLSTLHLWHHASVYAFTWHACRHHVAVGRWFISMNFVVHGLMYTYFALQALGWFKIPRPVSVGITTLQIIQMVTGVSLTSRIWWEKLYGLENCHHPMENIYFSYLIYSSYLALFLHFFVNAYIRRDANKKSKAQ